MATTKLDKGEVRSLLKGYGKICAPTNVFRFKNFLHPGQPYIPGINPLVFMSQAQSLLENSAYKDELDWVNKQLNNYASNLASQGKGNAKHEFDREGFLEAVQNIFKIKGKRQKIIHDHSFNYRQRKNDIFYYQNFTIQELAGFIDLLFQKHGGFTCSSEFMHAHKMVGINQIVPPLMDNTNDIFSWVKRRIPLAFFPSSSMFFDIKNTLFKIINIRLSGNFNPGSIKKYSSDYPPAYLFIPTNNFRFNKYKNELIKLKSDAIFSKLFETGAIQITKSKQFTRIFHLFQLGKKASEQLMKIKEDQGGAIFIGNDNLFMSDSLCMDRIYVHGPKNAYHTFLPKGMNPITSFPFFSYPEAASFNLNNGQRQNSQLSIDKKIHYKGSSRYLYQKKVKGIYDDGLPWSGFILKINNTSRCNFFIESFKKGTTIDSTRLIDKLKKNKNDFAASNGGYFINRKLINIEKLPPSTLWKPLGLVYHNDSAIGVPLFNKAAMIIDRSGQIHFDRVNIKEGFQIASEGSFIDFNKNHYNKYSNSECSFFDLMYKENYIRNDETIVLKLAGNYVYEVSFPEQRKTTSTSSVGLTLSIPPEKYSNDLLLNPNLKITLSNSSSINWEHTTLALEAGPMLLKDGDLCVDLDYEGWYLEKSIRTQIARIDMLNLRGPKMAIGTDPQGNIYLGGINGRLRNSVGSTYQEIVDFLLSEGVSDAIMLDSGGSSSLLSRGVFLNTPPFCKKKSDEVVLFGISEPREVANSIVIEILK